MQDITVQTRWRVEGNLEEVADILSQPAQYADWWQEGWKTSEVVDPGDGTGLGQTIRLKPLHGGPVSLSLVSDERPHAWVMQVLGDVSGQSDWAMWEDGPVVDINHEWSVALGDSALRLLGPLGRALHRRRILAAMRHGEAALSREIRRRRSHRGSG